MNLPSKRRRGEPKPRDYVGRIDSRLLESVMMPYLDTESQYSFVRTAKNKQYLQQKLDSNMDWDARDLDTISEDRKWYVRSVYNVTNLNQIEHSPHLTHLTFGLEFNQPVDLRQLQKLTHLNFGYNFDKRVNDEQGEPLLPPNLTHLTFGHYFNQPVDLSQLQKLTHLTFGGWSGDRFNRPVNTIRQDGSLGNSLLPPSLTNLTFGDSFEQKVDISQLQNLTHLTFGRDFNQEVDLRQ